MEKQQDKNQDIVELSFKQYALEEEIKQAIKQYVYFKNYHFISKFYENKAKKLIAEREKVLEKLATLIYPMSEEIEVLQ